MARLHTKTTEERSVATFVTGFVLPPDDGEGVEGVGGFLWSRA